MESNKFRESIATQEFNKVFGFISELDLGDEYVKIKLGISKLSSSKRSRILAYIVIRSKESKEFKEFIDKLNEVVESKLNNKNE